MNLIALKAPFAPAVISWRVGSTNKDKTKGMALAYIDARDVQDRLDAVCGADGWQCRYPHANGKTVCEIGVKVGDEWIWKADGAGDSDVEAEKGALSDAFKRAAVRWGIGRYLYDLESPWIEIEPAGKSYKIKDSEHAKLRALLTKHAASNATPPATAPKPKAVDNVVPMATPETPKISPEEWVENAKGRLNSIHKTTELAEWIRRNVNRVDALRTKDLALYNAINAHVSLRSEELQQKGL